MARRSFIKWLQNKYDSVQKLSSTWSKQLLDWENINPFLPEESPSIQAWLDQMEWYENSITQWADFWLQTARKALPSGRIELCVGGYGWPEIGTNYTQLAEICSRYEAGMRLTNEGNSYPWNFSITRWLVSACRYFRVPFGFEPASRISPKGNIARIYNAISSGAEHIHNFGFNVMEEGRLTEGAEAFKKYLHFLRCMNPHVYATAFFPRANILLKRSLLEVFLSRASQMRDILDFNFADEGLILRDALPSNGILFLIAGTMTYPNIIEKIYSWIKSGGSLITFADCIGEAPPGMAAWKDLIGDMAQVKIDEVASVSHYLPEHYSLDINEFPEEWGWYPADIWLIPDQFIENYRWSAPEAMIKIPARPATDHELTLRVRIPKGGGDIRIKDHVIGRLIATGDEIVEQHFHVPGRLVEPTGIINLKLHVSPYLRYKEEPLSFDERPLGIQLFDVKVRVSDSREKPTLLLNRKVQLRINEFKRKCIKHLRKGQIIYYPGRWSDREGYWKIITSLLKERFPDLTIDGCFDERYLTVLDEGILLYEKDEILLT